MKVYFALVIAILLTVGLMSDPLYAKDANKTAGKCPGGMVACVQRCVAAGGQSRHCPDYCQKTHGC